MLVPVLRVAPRRLAPATCCTVAAGAAKVRLPLDARHRTLATLHPGQPASCRSTASSQRLTDI